jgi:hypothetical protein
VLEPGKPSQALTRAEQKALAHRIVLTPAIADHIVANVGHGMFEKQSCEFAGISHVVYRQWQRWAEKGVEPYTGFFRRIQQAKQERIREALNRIHGSDPMWKAYAWWLDRVYPEWRENNKTDEPPPQVPQDVLIREIKARYTQEEISDIISELNDPDPVMPGLAAGGSECSSEIDPLLAG